MDDPDIDNQSAKLIKRRFIAGAICPHCRALDRLQIEYWQLGEREQEVRCCVACDYREQAVATGAQPARSLASLPRARRGEPTPAVPAQPVRLLDPKPDPNAPSAS